jgi:type II secretory pathway component PulJ
MKTDYARCRRHGFVFLEIVVAIGLMGLLLAGVYAGVQANEQELRQCTRQRQALDVLDNVVERLAAEAPVSRRRCAEVLAEEVARSELAALPHLATVCDTSATGGVHCELRNRGRLLARMEVGGHAQ